MNIEEGLRRIDSFAELKKGWLGEGEGWPISEATRTLAKAILPVLPQTPGGWYAVPTHGGNIAFESAAENVEVSSLV